jgi:hypothetical protein
MYGLPTRFLFCRVSIGARANSEAKGTKMASLSRVELALDRHWSLSRGEVVLGAVVGKLRRRSNAAQRIERTREARRSQHFDASSPHVNQAVLQPGDRPSCANK